MRTVPTPIHLEHPLSSWERGPGGEVLPQPPWLLPRTAYVHVPFCAHHCGYCDFAVTVGQDHQIELYLDALAIELSALGTPQPVETLFIGGGTPTHLSPSQLERLLTTLCHWLPLPAGAEFSVESTPESITDDKCNVLAAHGVSRISVGVQSFRPHLLHSLDRLHRIEHIPRAVEAVRKHVRSLSFDLIFAAPGATVTDWTADLDDALRYGTDHISTYGLTYEKGTPLWKQRFRGEVDPVTEDDELAMYETAIDTLSAAGFEHYEISNFARPDHRCRHNERYWANEAYHGFGVGAARYVHGARELNTRNTNDYIRKVLSGESPTFQSERIEGRERAVETAAIQLRRSDGVFRDRFREQTGFEFDPLFGERLTMLLSQGLLADTGLSVKLTRRGKFVADGVIEELMKHWPAEHADESQMKT
jgi:oxygen-independent coproporphyrinogen III oxidase